MTLWKVSRLGQNVTSVPRLPLASRQRLQRGLGHAVAETHFVRFRHGVTEAPLKVIGDAGGKRGTEVTFWPSPETFHNVTEFDYATLEHRLRELAFLNSGVRVVLKDERHADKKAEEMRYEGGLAEFVRYIDRSKTPLIDAPILLRGERTASASSWRCGGTTLPRADAPLHQQHPAARRRHASGGLPRGADARDQQVRRRDRHRQEGEGGAHRRRRARGLDRGALGQGAGPEVLAARPRTSSSPRK